MRDLKHLIYFENLLENADNELVEKAKADGKLAIGYTCFHIPEVLLNVDNCFSVRLRAPRTGSIDIATYYMSNYTCEFARALTERGIEGGYNFLDGLAGVDACWPRICCALTVCAWRMQSRCCSCGRWVRRWVCGACWWQAWSSAPWAQ